MAYDLKGRKLLWLTQLKGLSPLAHYLNWVRLERVNNEVLAVYGNEDTAGHAGRYVEIVDMKTGKTVGHKVFTKKADGKEDEKKEGGTDAKPAAGAPPAKTEAPKPLPENIVAAWKEAGAEVGWMRVDPTWVPVFVQEQEGKPGDLPAFFFGGVKAATPDGHVFFKFPLKEGQLAKLPAPATAFGLGLGHTQVTDAGLKELAELKNLQALDLSQNNLVTDAGLKELAGLKSLQKLTLHDTKVTDAGLKELAGLKNLQTLDLSRTKVTGVRLKELAGLKNLQTLYVYDAPVTDTGLKELAGLKNLQTLHFGNTQVTNVGLKELAELKSLQTLYLERTQVTDAGLKELQKALPGCRIYP